MCPCGHGSLSAAGDCGGPPGCICRDRRGANHRDTLQSFPVTSAAALRAAQSTAAVNAGKHLLGWRLFANMLTLSYSAFLPLSPRTGHVLPGRVSNKQTALAPALPSLCPTSSSREEPPSMRGVLGFGTVLFGKFLFALSVIFILRTWSFQCLTKLERRNPFQWERKARQFVLALSACLSLSQIMSLGTWAEMQTAKMQALSGTICTLMTAGSLSIGTLGQYSSKVLHKH